MKVLINRTETHWLAEVDGRPYTLNEHSIPIEVVVNAILKFHPSAEIDIHEALLINPNLRRWCNTMRNFWGKVRDWNLIGKALAHNDPIICDRCGGNAWWQPGFQGYECLRCYGKLFGNRGVHGWGFVKSNNLSGIGPALPDRLPEIFYGRTK